MPAEKQGSVVSQSVTWRKTGDEAVILNLETSEYYSANETGTLIWELLAKNRSPEKIAAELAEEYGITIDEAAADTSDFLRELARLKILTPKAGR